MKVPVIIDPSPLHDHSTAKSISQWIGPQKYKSFFSFAIVRNPWDWQVSLYNFAKKQKDHHQHELISSFSGFDEYIRWRCTNDVKFQRDFIYDDNGEKLVNFVGRYETLENDFNHICDKIGISANLPCLNVSKTKPYHEYYNCETKDLVRRTFAPDIELFGYDFE